jgi:hypothetical protein
VLSSAPVSTSMPPWAIVPLPFFEHGHTMRVVFVEHFHKWWNILTKLTTISFSMTSLWHEVSNVTVNLWYALHSEVK